MKQYEYIPHTADMRFRAYGKTLEEAFANSALAMFNVMLDTKKVEAKIKKKISVSAKEPERLLFEFLGKFLFLLDAENFVLHEVPEIKIENNGGKYLLSATLSGDTLSDKYETQTQVKAITYNEMSVKQEPERVTVTAVVDV